MSRRTTVITVALLALISARMPVWREAGVATAPAPTAVRGDCARSCAWAGLPHEQRPLPVPWRRLGIILQQDGD